MGVKWDMSGDLAIALNNWFVLIVIIVHAVMLFGFFAFLVNPAAKWARWVLALSLFGVCGSLLVLAVGREVAIGKLIQLFVG